MSEAKLLKQRGKQDKKKTPQGKKKAAAAAKSPKKNRAHKAKAKQARKAQNADTAAHKARGGAAAIGGGGMRAPHAAGMRGGAGGGAAAASKTPAPPPKQSTPKATPAPVTQPKGDAGGGGEDFDLSVINQNPDDIAPQEGLKSLMVPLDPRDPDWAAYHGGEGGGGTGGRSDVAEPQGETGARVKEAVKDNPSIDVDSTADDATSDKLIAPPPPKAKGDNDSDNDPAKDDEAEVKGTRGAKSVTEDPKAKSTDEGDADPGSRGDKDAPRGGVGVVSGPGRGNKPVSDKERNKAGQGVRGPGIDPGKTRGDKTQEPGADGDKTRGGGGGEGKTRGGGGGEGKTRGGGGGGEGKTRGGGGGGSDTDTTRGGGGGGSDTDTTRGGGGGMGPSRGEGGGGISTTRGGGGGGLPGRGGGGMPGRGGPGGKRGDQGNALADRLAGQWIATHPSPEVQGKGASFAVAVNALEGQGRDLHGNIKPPIGGRGKSVLDMINPAKDIGAAVKAIKANPFSATKGPWYERVLAVLNVVKPIIDTVGGVADKVGLITTIAGLVTFFIPPVAAFCLTVGRVANIVSLVAKGASFGISILQAFLSAVAIRFEKDPVKRVQMAGYLRESIQSGVGAGLDLLLSKVTAGGKAVGKAGGKGFMRGFKQARAGGAGVLSATGTGIKRGMSAMRGAGKGVLLGAKNEIKKTTVKGMFKSGANAFKQKLLPTKEIGKELKNIGAIKASFGKQRTSNFSKVKRDYDKGGMRGVMGKDGYMAQRIRHVTGAEESESLIGFGGLGGPMKVKLKGPVGDIIQKGAEAHTGYEEKDYKKVAGEQRKEQTSAVQIAGQNKAAGGGRGGAGDALDRAEQHMLSLMGETGGGARGPSATGREAAAAKAPVPAPTDSDAVAQDTDIEGLQATRGHLTETAPAIDADIAEATARRDEMLSQVRPAAIEGGKEAKQRANDIAEQKTENEADQQGFVSAREEAAKNKAETAKTRGQGSQAQSETGAKVAEGNAVMNPEPMQSKVDEENKKKADELYAKEKKEWDEASLLGKAWKSVKKFAKSVWDFMKSAAAWVMKNVIQPIIDKVKSVIASVMNYITNTIMKFLLKTVGGMSDAEAEMLSFGEKANEKIAKSKEAGEELGKANTVALEASDKATSTEKAAIEEANACNENIATGNALKQQVAEEQTAVDAEIAQDKAAQANFKSRFMPYFIEQATESQGGARNDDKEAGGRDTPEVKTGPTVDLAAVNDYDVAAKSVEAESLKSQSETASELEILRGDQVSEAIEANKKKVENMDEDAQGKASKDGWGLGGSAVEGDKKEQDKIIADNSARFRNESMIYIKQLIGAHGKVEQDRRGRVANYKSTAAGLRGQELAAVHAAMHRIASGIRQEEDGVPLASRETKQKAGTGLKKMFG